MKFDELKPLVFSLKDFAYIDEPAAEKNFENPHDHAVYKATEVDATIAELKQKLEDAEADAAETLALLEERNRQVGELTENERRLKRALWLARAERAKWQSCYYWYAVSRKHDSRMYDEVERKCRAKAEEYK